MCSHVTHYCAVKQRRIVPNYKVDTYQKAVAKKAEKAVNDIKSGKLKIFSGPLVDNTGKEIKEILHFKCVRTFYYSL